MRRAAALLVLLLLPALAAEAREPVAYGPVPASIGAILADEAERELIGVALPREPRHLDREVGRAILVLLGDVGLRPAAERLAEGVRDPREKTELLAVVAAADHPDADLLLARAAREPRAEHRVLAADGLGRARTAHAVPALVELARDPIPAVRIAALRSLFAHESAQAVAARLAVPEDTEPDLLARRLRWHARARDHAPALTELATRAWRRGSTAELRMAAAAYLVSPAADAPIAQVQRVMDEMGRGPLRAALVRRALGVPEDGYDPVEMRRVAIDAVVALLDRKEASPEQRRAWIDLAVEWVARPVPMDPFSTDPIPEYVLRRRLPDLGGEILAPVAARLERHGFDEPRVGAILLRELGPVSLPKLRRMLAEDHLPARFASRADQERARYLRVAAAGAIQEFGRVGDEALARRILQGGEEDLRSLRMDFVHALEGDEGAWVVPLLVELAQGEDAELRRRAIGVLEGRAEPEARTFLVEDLFARCEQPHYRLSALVQRGDAFAFELLGRALADPRSAMRKAALGLFSRDRHPQLCGAEGRKVLLAYAPELASSQEVQAYVYALAEVAPEEAVRYVRETWDAFPKEDLGRTVLRVLGSVRGEAARGAVVDLALEKAGGSEDRALLLAAGAAIRGPTGRDAWARRPEQAGAFWRRLLLAEDVALQREALHAWEHPDAPPATARLLELLARALDGKALPERDSTPEGEQAFASAILSTFPTQPWAEVESRVLDVILDPLNEYMTRHVAAQLLPGRLSEAARKQLIAWLDYLPRDGSETSDAPGRIADPEIQLYLAAAIGYDGGPVIATLLFETLRRELFAFYSPALLARMEIEGPQAVRRAAVEDRLVALARGIGSTQHVPTILAMLDLVFDARFATYARVCVERQRFLAAAAGPAAAARTPSDLKVLGHDEGALSNWGMPMAVHNVLYETKMLDDETLARGLAETLGRARRDGRLARFPALYARRVLANLLEPTSGRKPRAADALLAHAHRVGRPDGPMHFFMHQSYVAELAEALRFEEAAREQRELVRILVRGNHDDTHPGMWERERAMQDALEGAAAAARGEEATAEASFRRGVLRAPYDPNVLNGVAWYRALAGHGLEQAEVDALRARRLEARVESRPGVNATDTFAWILLHRGRPLDGLRVLGPRMSAPEAARNGMLHLHMAQMYAAAGRLRSARDALERALTWDRALAARLADDPWLAPLFAKLPLAEIEALAAVKRFYEEGLPGAAAPAVKGPK